jgi:NTP pyrophosphatase (non-canonical NTP hydrolase)
MAKDATRKGGWDLAEHVDRLIEFREARDWQQFHRPKELAAALAIEAAELQELFLWRDAESAEVVAGDVPRMEKIRQEIADVAIFLVMLAHDLGIDLPAALAEKIASNEKRYPVDQHKGVAWKADHPE